MLNPDCDMVIKYQNMRTGRGLTVDGISVRYRIHCRQYNYAAAAAVPAFTLVEILIVVVILGVLAAIVIPQFSQVSAETNLTALKGNLQTVRSQIQLYKIQHNDLLPGQTTFGDAVTEEAFITALTINDGTYGPYLKKMPENLYIADHDSRDAITCVNAAAATPTGSEGTGWWFNVATVDFRASDSPEHIIY
jgi:general secretion pathway protein G